MSGWKWVPVEPTPEMLDAADTLGVLTQWQAKEHWHDMLDAAPPPDADAVVTDAMVKAALNAFCQESDDTDWDDANRADMRRAIAAALAAKTK